MDKDIKQMFELVLQKLDNMETRQESMEKSLSSMEKRQEGMEKRQDIMEKGMVSLEKGMVSMGKRQDEVFSVVKSIEHTETPTPKGQGFLGTK